MTSYDGWIGENVPDHIMEEAASWMAFLDSCECTPADRIAFVRWLGRDRMHQSAFEELSEVWARLHTLTDIQQVADHPDVIPFPAPADSPKVFADERASGRAEWSALVACLLVMVGAAVHFLFGTPSDLHVTEVGEIQTITLEDGSQVELNARSTIKVQVGDRRREIRLNEGEAVFHVKEDDRPFVVRTDLATISAVGTRFSVRSDPSFVEVSVIDGLVSVAATNSNTVLTEYDSDLLMRFTDEIALLGAGQRLELTRESKQFKTISDNALKDDLSWRNGEVVFDEIPLVTVLAEMRRYHGAGIYIGDPVLNGLRVSGRFPTNDSSYFLTQLREKYGVSVERDEQDFIILRSAPQ